MRLLWAHSCFDKLWNTAASERMRRYGTEVVVGDLVLPRESIFGIPEESSPRGIKPRLVTAKDLEEKKYEIWDVVMPLLGWNVLWPSHEVGSYYKQLIMYDGFGMESLEEAWAWDEAALPERWVHAEAHSATVDEDKDDWGPSLVSDNYGMLWKIYGAYRHLVSRPKDFEYKAHQLNTFFLSAFPATLTITLHRCIVKESIKE